jgi:hypothetical protein
VEKNCQCRLCRQFFSEEEMSEEHYPAKSVGNDDIIALDIVKMFDSFQTEALRTEIMKDMINGKSFEEASDAFFDNELAQPLYPKGRTARTLCRKCNAFLGKYDEAYLKFFNADGNPKVIKGFQRETRMAIIKAIFGKFLSIPEAANEQFDFIDFIMDKSQDTYNGNWHLYFVHRDFSSDILGLADIGTGRAEYDEGIVYELSDEKFIFNLMNFEKHSCFIMNEAFDILDNQYKLITGVGKGGGYHASILMSRLLHLPFEE